MTLGWGNDTQTGGGNWGQAWTLNLQKADEGWCAPRKSSAQKAAVIEGPPGLTVGGSFDVLTLAEAMNEGQGEVSAEESLKDFPPLGNKDLKSKRMKMTPMPNYSKNAIRKTHGEWKEKKVPKGPLECNMLTKAPEAKELHPFIGPKPTSDGWVRVKGVMDSGASESVAPPSMCPHYKIHPSPGSLAGQHYVSASEDTIANLGEQYLNIVTDAGKGGVAKYQVAEVSRPLNAVSEICDAGGKDGQTVVFTKYGGYIVNNTTGTYTDFAREDGVYTLEFWVSPPSEGVQGFQGQG